MKNIILVEGKDDKAFIEYLIQGVEVKEFSVDILGGLNKDALTRRLASLKTSFLKNPFGKLGIIIDQDSFTKEERLAFVNECLQESFDIQLSDSQLFIDLTIDEIPLQIACYFVNIDGTGELESLLTRIKTNPSPYADCLQQWQNCLSEKVSQKEFDKLWVHYYLKYDTATHQERQQAGRYCTLEYSLQHKSHIWDLDSPILNELKGFLAMFD
ncbi:MAG: DUF3226 domain-containing protein [Flectobacillus sp.]|uniref:DUF3226 domain-containing protein n=1 Tax=Flectobacillus sp. TaxID=50419 RepID=UPI003B9A0245